MSQLVVISFEYLSENATSMTPARPLNIICVLDIGRANIVTLIIMSAEDISAEPKAIKPSLINSGYLKISSKLMVFLIV